MNNRRKIFYTILLVLSTACFGSCTKADDERAYKNAATELNGLMSRYKEIPAPQRQVKGKNGGYMMTVDNRQRDEFVEKTKDEWVGVSKKLRAVPERYPDSRWADDSLFCLALYALAPAGDADFKDIYLTALEKLVYGHPAFKLEDWTISAFNKTVFEKYISTSKRLFPEGVSLDDMNRASLKLALAAVYERDGKRDESIKLLGEVRDKYPGTKFAGLLQNKIDEIADAGR